LFAISIFKRDGKKVVDSELTVPLEYSYMAPSSTGGTVVICTTFSGAQKRFSWLGKPIVAK
jgi:hypothetical protein